MKISINMDLGKLPDDVEWCDEAQQRSLAQGSTIVCSWFLAEERRTSRRFGALDHCRLGDCVWGGPNDGGEELTVIPWRIVVRCSKDIPTNNKPILGVSVCGVLCCVVGKHWYLLLNMVKHVTLAWNVTCVRITVAGAGMEWKAHGDKWVEGCELNKNHVYRLDSFLLLFGPSPPSLSASSSLASLLSSSSAACWLCNFLFVVFVLLAILSRCDCIVSMADVYCMRYIGVWARESLMRGSAPNTSKSFNRRSAYELPARWWRHVRPVLSCTFRNGDNWSML